MTQFNSSNIKLSNLQLNKLNSAIKNKMKVVLRLSSNTAGNSHDETNFPHKLLVTNRQVANLSKSFSSHSSANTNLPKTQLCNIIQLGGILGTITKNKIIIKEKCT